MDTVLADLVVFGVGALCGGLLTVLIGFKVVELAIRKITFRMIEQGWFLHNGRTFLVSPQPKRMN